MPSDASDKSSKPQLGRICYIHPVPLSSGAASAIQVMRMCEGFAQVGSPPVLLSRGTGDEVVCTDGSYSLFDYYGIRDHFDIVSLPTRHLRRCGVALGLLSSVLFACRATARARSIKADLVYTRDIYSAWLAAERGLPVLFEEHEPPRKRLHESLRRRLFASRNITGVVFISHALEACYRTRGLLDTTFVRTMVAHDAASTSQIRPIHNGTMVDGRRLVVGYVGSFLPGRGIELVLSLAAKLSHIQFRLVGGTLEQIQSPSLRVIPANVECCGFVEPARVSALFDEMDILLMPYQTHTTTRGGTVSVQWMSPLKMFEYMASGVPLIASDLPVLREVLVPEYNGLLVAPDDVGAWAQAIQRLAVDCQLRQRLARAAVADIRAKYNWAKRAEAIVNHLVAPR